MKAKILREAKKAIENQQALAGFRPTEWRIINVIDSHSIKVDVRFQRKEEGCNVRLTVNIATGEVLADA
jgi:hypothetical protein